MTRIIQVFEACGIALEDPKDRRWLKLTLSIMDIPEERLPRSTESIRRVMCRRLEKHDTKTTVPAK
jgi:hypothetical protein